MMRMLLAATLLLAAAGEAMAADLPPVAPPPRAPATYVPIAAPIYNWSGIYIGINGGYGFGDTNWTAVPTGSFNVDGGLVGGTIGANWQMGPAVFGIEADGDWQGISGHDSVTSLCGGICETKSDWVATVRGRLGYAFDRVLLFGTGGVAFGGIQSGFTGGPYQNNTEVGWTAGAGLEFAITDNVTAKVEYLFIDLSNATCNVDCGGTTPVSFYESAVRGGINFKFNPF